MGGLLQLVDQRNRIVLGRYRASTLRVDEEPVELEQTHPSGETHWTMMREVAGGIARGLEAATPEQRAEVDRAVLEVVGTGPYTARGRAWIASATR